MRAHMGLVAQWHVESSQTKDPACVPCIGRWVLNHWTTRKVQNVYFQLYSPLEFQTNIFSSLCYIST